MGKKSPKVECMRTLIGERKKVLNNDRLDYKRRRSQRERSVADTIPFRESSN